MAASYFKPLNRPEFTSMPRVCCERELGFDCGFFGITIAGQDYKTNFEFVFLGELVVPFVMGRHAHDGAGAIVDEDVVRDPDRNLLAVEWIDGVAAGIDAMLFDFANVADFPGLALLGNQLINRGAEHVVIFGQPSHQRMLRGELQRCRAENSVDTRGEDGDRRMFRIGRAIDLEIHQGAFAPADPVALHGTDFFRPAGKMVQVV